MHRTTFSELERLVKRQGIGITSKLPGSIGLKAGNSGAKHDLEYDSSVELEGAEKVQVRYAGKVLVRIRFYRHRLADYSRAISEKALLDCAVYAGLIKSDSESQIRLVDEGQFKVDSKAEERTELTFEYEEVDFNNLWDKNERKDGR